MFKCISWLYVFEKLKNNLSLTKKLIFFKVSYKDGED